MADGILDLVAALGIILFNIAIGFVVVKAKYIPSQALGGIGPAGHAHASSLVRYRRTGRQTSASRSVLHRYYDSGLGQCQLGELVRILTRQVFDGYALVRGRVDG